VIGPVLAYVLWRGIGPRPLVAGSAFLLVVVVPLMYLIIGPVNQGGYSFGYSNSLLLVHWVAVTAVFLLALATGRMLAAARGRYVRRRPADGGDGAGRATPPVLPSARPASRPG
jgi:hypothetical protein